MAISYGKPENRRLHFQRPHLSFDLQEYTIGTLPPRSLAPTGQDASSDQCHYIYVCRKKPGAEDVCKANWPLVEALIKKAEEEEAR